MGAGASTEKSAQERKNYGNLAGAVVSAKALRAALPHLKLVNGDASPTATEMVVRLSAQWYNPPLFGWEPLLEPLEVGVATRTSSLTTVNLGVQTTVDINISDALLRAVTTLAAGRRVGAGANFSTAGAFSKFMPGDRYAPHADTLHAVEWYDHCKRASQRERGLRTNGQP